MHGAAVAGFRQLKDPSSQFHFSYSPSVSQPGSHQWSLSVAMINISMCGIVWRAAAITATDFMLFYFIFV